MRNWVYMCPHTGCDILPHAPDGEDTIISYHLSICHNGVSMKLGGNAMQHAHKVSAYDIDDVHSCTAWHAAAVSMADHHLVYTAKRYLYVVVVSVHCSSMQLCYAFEMLTPGAGIGKGGAWRGG